MFTISDEGTDQSEEQYQSQQYSAICVGLRNQHLNTKTTFTQGTQDDPRTSWKTKEHELNTESCSPELLFLNIKITGYYFLEGGSV